MPHKYRCSPHALAQDRSFTRFTPPTTRRRASRPPRTPHFLFRSTCGLGQHQHQTGQLQGIIWAARLHNSPSVTWQKKTNPAEMQENSRQHIQEVSWREAQRDKQISCTTPVSHKPSLYRLRGRKSAGTEGRRRRRR